MCKLAGGAIPPKNSLLTSPATCAINNLTSSCTKPVSYTHLVYVQIGEPQNPDMVLCEKLCAQTVGLLLLGRVMPCPVQLDDKPCFCAVEISDIAADRSEEHTSELQSQR